MALRIISGIRKGYRIIGPEGDHSRPTEDRIKENIFNIISPIENYAIVLDLFSCTGNIGLEFLSRGAKKVYFSEINKSNLLSLEKNIEHTKFEKESVILKGDFRKNILMVLDNIDYVYLDPPYSSGFYEIALEQMLKLDRFKNSLYITEMNEDINFSEKFNELDLVYEKKYGKKYIKFYREKE